MTKMFDKNDRTCLSEKYRPDMNLNSEKGISKINTLCYRRSAQLKFTQLKFTCVVVTGIKPIVVGQREDFSVDGVVQFLRTP